MKKMCFDAILSPASANALKVPGSMRVLNCHLPVSEKARIVREHKWDNLLVDIEHDMRSVGVVQRTWLDSFGSLWGHIELQDERGAAFVRSMLAKHKRMPEISLTVCYAADGLPGNTMFNPMSASDFNSLLAGMGGAVIRSYEARAISLVENGDVPCSTANAITFASAAQPKLGEMYVINRGARVDKVMSTPESKKETPPASAPPAANAPPAADVSADDEPLYSKKQMMSVLLSTKSKIESMNSRTAALPNAIRVLNTYDLNERQQKRLSDFVAAPATYPEFAKVEMFLEDFIEPDDAKDEKKEEKTESEPEVKKRKLNEASKSLKTPAADASKKKKETAAGPAVSPEIKELLEAMGMGADAFNGSAPVSDDFNSMLGDMLGGAKVEKVKK